eukprot:SAG22_NODE_338_length_12038_cov_24.655583_2_plen_561_part_00
MWRARFETEDSREEYHFIDRDDASRQLQQAGQLFNTQVVAARRRNLGEGSRVLSGEFKSALPGPGLDMNFDEIMYLLQEQLWGADDSGKSEFEATVRRGLGSEARYKAMVAAFENGEEEYGYRCAELDALQGPARYHVMDTAECVALLAQLRETFEMELGELTRRDSEGECVDGDEDGDSEISDMQDMMDTLAPLDAEALLAVAVPNDEKEAIAGSAAALAARDARLGSWGGKYLVSDLYAQADWLRDHAKTGREREPDSLVEITCTVYSLWLCGGCVTSAHWLYLATKGRSHWQAWRSQRGTIPAAPSGPPPPPEIICGITGKVMQDPYRLRTAAAQGVAATTTNQKLFSCNHTFEGEALFKALSVERKCPRCGMRPFTSDTYRQRGIKALMQKSAQVGNVVDRWYIVQNLAPPSAPPPPSNVWPCLRHVLLGWFLVGGSAACRHFAFALAEGCGTAQEVLAGNSTATAVPPPCAWDQQSAGVAWLYTCHLFLGLGAVAKWVGDGLSGRHTAVQVAGLQRLTLLCTRGWSEAWGLVVVLGVTFLLFAGWSLVISTEMIR